MREGFITMKTSIEDLKRKRFFKVKKAQNHFLCPLCSAPREMRYSKNLNEKQFIQIAVLSGSLIYFLFPIMGFKAFSLFFVVWVSFEVVNKLLYRKEIPCPYCGFDATWYKRDVRVAKQKVEEFWKERGVDNTVQNILDKQKQQREPENVPTVNPEVFSQENADSILKDSIGSNLG